jgi:hypothetical protein
MTLNIIFLDIDGVIVLEGHEIDLSPASEEEKRFLNDTKWKWRLRTIRSINPIAVGLINRLAKETNSQIVLSSDWRRYDTIGDIEDLLKFHGLEVGIIGKTPEIEGPRGREILVWLESTWLEIDKFVIIDDRDDMDKVKTFLVKTDWNIGFTTQQLFNQAKDILT